MSPTGTKKRKIRSREDGLQVVHGSLARVVDLLEMVNAPADTPEGELLAGLKPVFERFESRIKATYSIPQEHELVGAALKSFCKEHERPYKERNANMALAVGYLLQAFMETLKFPKDDAAPDLARLLRQAEAEDKPLCCRLSEEKRLELLTHIRPSTGDAKLDEEEAATCAPDVLQRYFTEPLQ